MVTMLMKEAKEVINSNSIEEDQRKELVHSTVQEAANLYALVNELYPHGKVIIINTTDLLESPEVDSLELKEKDSPLCETINKGNSLTQYTDIITNRDHNILSNKQVEVLNHIASGKTNMEIGYVLHISEQTVKSHVSAILRKLHAHDRAHSVYLGIISGLL
ncbi:response regulator transcription factor, partial [Chloroflexota bacterium]